MKRFYPIGTPGLAWSDDDKAAWLSERQILRSYHDEVIAKLDDLDAAFTRERYGALPIDPGRYPLFGLKNAHPDPDKPWVLITGGVHGYETSGVQGALAFVREVAASYAARVNLMIAPCVSPWGYEVINRWNPMTLDPNRSFVAASPCEEAAALMGWVNRIDGEFLMHIDLHETTDSDEEEFRPALAARDGKAFDPGLIPDGFYTVADARNPQPEFQAAIIAAVEQITHVAPPDENGQIIGADVTQHGVIHYAFGGLGLCAGMTQAPFTSTTEVYPDSDKATAAICNEAQVAAVTGALDYALAHSTSAAAPAPT
jgi:hypothetical protein